MQHARAARFNAMFQIRTTENLADAVERAADKRVQTRSDYIRTAIVDRLQADGIDLNSLGGAA